MSPHLTRAQLLIDHDRFAEAEQELALALADDPDHYLAHTLLAVCLLERDQYDEATRQAQQAVGLAPDAPGAHYVLALVWLTRNHLEEAEAAAREAIALDPLDADCQVLVGRIHFVAERWRQALAAAETALAIDPEHVGALNLRAKSLRKLGQPEAAGDQLRAALAVAPDNTETHASLGWLWLEQGDRKQAIHHFREALRLNPELDVAREGVVESLKAWNPVYRLFLKYIFWMQRLGSRGQWLVILGAWLAFNVAEHVRETHPEWGVVVWPLLVGYVVFVLITWLARPLANLALRLHPLGRLALSHDERIASNWIGGFLIGAIASGLTFLVLHHPFWIVLTVVLAGMLLPLSATFQAPAPWPRRPLKIYTAIIGSFGAILVGGLFVSEAMLRNWPPAAIQFWGVLGRVCIWGFLAGVLLSPWVGNILWSVRWKR